MSPQLESLLDALPRKQEAGRPDFSGNLNVA